MTNCNRSSKFLSQTQKSVMLMCFDLNVTRTWKSFCYTENSGCKDIWLMYSVLPIPRAGKILEYKNFRLFGEAGQTPSWSQVQAGGLLVRGMQLSCLFIADPVEEQRCKKLWTQGVDVAPGAPSVSHTGSTRVCWSSTRILSSHLTWGLLNFLQARQEPLQLSGGHPLSSRVLPDSSFHKIMCVCSSFQGGTS